MTGRTAVDYANPKTVLCLCATHVQLQAPIFMILQQLCLFLY
ncbi:MAG: hypothetical protein JETT_1923 [Candidatus Jettenia ecosi]|uniref:Uncharacterized protein n=1 Tax=Candidatus Jettenia ecosi TaxID=2494326 RepID=A0A533QAV0_9BACT|nr:MAG: hypothetical protein JETT_1923 [Candidatus Jettenia ecosi]